MSHFADRLTGAIKAKGNGVLVGLDPRLAHLPDEVRPQSDSWEDIAVAYENFCKRIIDVVADLVPATKPQAAFFEQLGPAGMAALREVISYAKQKQLVVILDAKRSDIGSTAQAYASAYLGEGSPYGAESLTVNPYLGGDSLSPFLDPLEDQSTGIFVLVKTSNPGGKDFQDLAVGGSETKLFHRVADMVEKQAAESLGDSGYGNVGAVVGATYPEELVELRRRMPHSILLIPGYGSQGGTAKDVVAGFDEQGGGALVNSSRAIIFAHQRPEFEHLSSNWQSAVEEATKAMIAELGSEFAALRNLHRGSCH